jgi:CheY-like chemotaxis protein
MPHTPLPITNRLFRRLHLAIERAPMDRTGKERLTHLAVFVFFGLPMLLAYGISGLVAGDLLLAALIFVASTSLALGWLLLCHLPLGLIVYRVSAIIYGGFLLYVLVVGGEGGSKSLWMLTFPLFIVLLVGIKEGIAWAALLLAAALALLLVPLPGVQPFPYNNAFIVRFASVYVIIAAIACWSEHFRLYYRNTQELELNQLRSLINGLPDAVRLDDSAGRPLLCNQAYLAMTGLCRDEVFEEEMIDSQQTPPGMEPCSIQLPVQAGKVYQLLIWREHLPGGSPQQHPSTASQDTAERPAAGQCDPAGQVEPAPAIPAGNLDTSSAPTVHPLPATILFAEDDPMLRQLGTQMLASLGYQVMAAADGEEAVALYHTHQQDIGLVLCDQWMPRLDGWQLLSALHAINPSVPVIMISGAAASPAEGLEHNEQPNAYLKKPYGMDMLQDTIQQVLQHKHIPTTE